MQDHGDLNKRLDVFGKALKKHFQWPDIRLTVEFKRSKRDRRFKMKRPPEKYMVMNYAAPKEKYMEEYRQGMDPSAEPTDKSPVPATTSAAKPSNKRKPFLMQHDASLLTSAQQRDVPGAPTMPLLRQGHRMNVSPPVCRPPTLFVTYV